MGGVPPLRLRRPSARLVIAVLVVLVIAGFLASMLASTDGHFVPQVVDLYVVAQYASAMAHGHPFHYNLGEPPSSGSTSLLYTAILAAGQRVGFAGEALIGLAIALGALFYAGSVALAWRLGRLLGGEPEAALAAALLALGGASVWGYLYGSDVALFMLLSLWLLERLLVEWDRPVPWGFAAVGMLLALTRPEGLLFALLLGGGLALRRSPSGSRRGRFVALLPVALGFALLGFNRWLTGAWLGSSVSDKSLIANYGLREALGLASAYGQDVLRGLLLGFYPASAPLGFAQGFSPFYFAPLALVAVILALAMAPERYRPGLALWAVTAFLAAGLVSLNVFMGVHFNRYLMWAFPVVQVLVAVGIGRAAEALARGEAGLRGRLFAAGAALALVSGSLSTVHFGAVYGEMAGQVWRRDVKAADWIKAHLPHGVGIANVATSVEYLTGHRNLNLHGVTSPYFFGNRTAEREAGMVESLARLPAALRPPYLLTSESAQAGYPALRELVAGPPLFRTQSFSDELMIFRLRWDLVGRNRLPYRPESLVAIRGRTEVDHLNVCDRLEEARHDYRFESRLGDLALWGTARAADYPGPGGPGRVLDAGRAIFGSETFRIRCQPGRDLVLVLRTAATVDANLLRATGSGRYAINFPEAAIRVRTGGREVAARRFRPREGWDEIALLVPGSALPEGRATLRVSGRYASFYYWFYQ